MLVLSAHPGPAATRLVLRDEEPDDEFFFQKAGSDLVWNVYEVFIRFYSTDCPIELHSNC